MTAKADIAAISVMNLRIVEPSLTRSDPLSRIAQTSPLPRLPRVGKRHSRLDRPPCLADVQPHRNRRTPNPCCTDGHEPDSQLRVTFRHPGAHATHLATASPTTSYETTRLL